jgi:hypothetical protein
VHTSFCKQEFGEEEQILLMDFEAKHEYEKNIAFSIPKGEKKCKLGQQYWVGFIPNVFFWGCHEPYCKQVNFSCI